MGKALRVLNIEDSERDSVLLTRHITAAGYDLTIDRVDTPDGMKAALDAAEWDIIICDYSMPKFNALHALELLRGTGIDIPFVIISGTVGEDTSVQAMLTGAHDYIQKGNLTRLVPAIERELHQARNRREQRQIKSERQAIYEIIQGAISSPDLDEYLKLVHRTVSRIVYAENFIVMLHDSATDVFEYAFWADKFDAQPPPRPVGHGFGSYVLRTGRPLLLTRELKKELVDRGEATLSGTPSLSWIGVPLRTPSRIIGVIVLQHYEIENAFSQRVLEFLSSVADQIALAVERKRAEDTIAASEGRYRDLVENAIDIIYTHDLEGNYTSVNRAAERITGFTRGETLAMNIAETVAPEYLEMGRQMIAAELAGDPVTAYELELVTKDGNGVVVEANTRIIYQNDVPVGVQGIARDITERKAAEKQLLLQATALEAAANAIVITDTEGIISWVHPAFTELTGYSLSDVVGQNPRILKSGEMDPNNYKSLWDTVLSGQAWRGEMTNRRKDGTTYVEEQTITPVLDDTGKITNFIAIKQDVTGPKRDAEALSESRRLVEGIMDAIPARVFWKDNDLVYLGCNAAFARDAGFADPKDIIGKDDYQMVWRDQAESYQADDRQVIEAGKSKLLLEESQTTPEGKEITILTSKIPLLNSAGEIRGVLGTYVDITDRKHLEEQLRQSQKMEAVGVLAGGVAHDFNNLLTAINGYSALTLKKMQPDDPFRNNIEEVKKAGDRAAELTGQLLAFSRKQVLNPVVLSLNNVIFNIEKMLRRLISEGVELRVISVPNLGNVKADPGQIEQVIMNLAVNARDAMPNGGTLSLETQNVYLDEAYVSQHNNVSPGQFIRLTITDTGEGMDERTKEHIFEPFYTTKGVGKGTGLGLSIVYGIVKQSGGDILVYSEMGHGTSFKIYLPCVDESVQKSKRPGDREELYFGTETVLLVEDEDIVRTLVREVLTDNGYKVLEAAGGEAALAICESYVQPIHLLLTDIIMPKMGGGDLTDLVTKMRPDICVLFMSGYTDDAVTHRGINNADLAFIEKPFTPDGLARKVREVLGSGRSDTILAADLTT